MDPLLTTGLIVGAATGALALKTIFNKTSKLTTAVASLTAVSSALTFAASSSDGGLVSAIMIPAFMVASAIGSAWNIAALYENWAMRETIKEEFQAQQPKRPSAIDKLDLQAESGHPVFKDQPE